MLIYNKVEDIFHTCLRIYSHLHYLNAQTIDLNTIILVDFIYCFPQYASQLSRKRKLSFLKSFAPVMVYNGSKSSHKYVLEKSIYGAMRLLEAKGIVSLTNGRYISLQPKIEGPPIPLSEPLMKLYDFIRAEGVNLINENLSLFENSYEKTS